MSALSHLIACGGQKHGHSFKKGRENTIEYFSKGERLRSEYDFIGVASDPQVLEGMKKTPKEKIIFSTNSMKSFVFQTTLIEVPKAKDDDNHCHPIEVFVPDDKLQGHLRSYRSETRKEAYKLAMERGGDRCQVFKDLMSEVESELVVCYQQLGPDHVKLSEDALQEVLLRGMHDAASWFPYDPNQVKIKKTFQTKYFNHFTMDSLKNGPSNWDILNLQEKKNTIYVHASSAFESVLHIYNYINLLWNECGKSFPQDKDCRIAIIGAGPSGLLLTRKLVQMGFTNVTIYESKKNDDGPENFFAGKTQITMIANPFCHSDDSSKIPVELGTCYFSPDYKQMIEDFHDAGLLGPDQDKNLLISLDQLENGPVEKGLFVGDQFEEDGPFKMLFQNYPDIRAKYAGSDGKFPTVMNLEDYQVAKGFEEVYKKKVKNKTPEELKTLFSDFFLEELGPAAIKYIIYHAKNYGETSPFPSNRSRVKTSIFSTDIYSFLQKKGFMPLIGLLQFGYSLQGYGSTSTGTEMSAFYFMMWITPNIFFTLIHNDLKDFIAKELKRLPFFKPSWVQTSEDFPIYGAFSKGWGSIWKNLKDQLQEGGVEIKYGVSITEIKRDNVV